MESRSKRRQQAYKELDLTSVKEAKQIDHSIEKEKQRRQKKELKKIEIETSQLYQVVKHTATYMDKYFLDPIIGLIPVLGDFLSSLACLPAIYLSLAKIRSIPLTLAVISNALIDSLVGMIPFWIGNIIDIFHQSNLRNFKLIQGFVEDDKEVIDKVNRRAVWMGILIAITCYAIYLMILLVQKLWGWAESAFTYLYNLIA